MDTFSYKANSSPPISSNDNSLVQNFWSDSNAVIDKIQAAYAVSF